MSVRPDLNSFVPWFLERGNALFFDIGGCPMRRRKSKHRVKVFNSRGGIRI